MVLAVVKNFLLNRQGCLARSWGSPGVRTGSRVWATLALASQSWDLRVGATGLLTGLI